jgi:hypothetical protein
MMVLKNIVAQEDSGNPIQHQVTKLVLSTVGAFLMKQMIEVYYDYVRASRKAASPTLTIVQTEEKEE